VNLSLEAISGLVVAILGGAAVGVERQQSGHATGPDARLGGVRTFTLLGTVAGIAGIVTAAGYAVAAEPGVGSRRMSRLLALDADGRAAENRDDQPGDCLKAEVHASGYCLS